VKEQNQHILERNVDRADDFGLGLCFLYLAAMDADYTARLGELPAVAQPYHLCLLSAGLMLLFFTGLLCFAGARLLVYLQQLQRCVTTSETDRALVKEQLTRTAVCGFVAGALLFLLS
jgi:hypothetical protein